MTIKPALQKLLKDILERDNEEKNARNPNRMNPPGKVSN